MNQMKFETLASGFSLLEAPRVDEQGQIYFSDAVAGGVYRLAPGGQPETLISTERKLVGGMAFTESGALLMTGPTVALWDSSTGNLTDIFKSYKDKPNRAFNDLTVDDQGSVFVGTVNARDTLRPDKLPEVDPGDIFRLDEDGSVNLVWEGGLEASNGMGFSPDGKILYHVDAFTRLIYAYDVTADRKLVDRRIFVRFEEGWGWPDGMAVDAEGGVWAPALFGGTILRFASDGTLSRKIEAPVKKVVTLVFGGPDLCDLYILSAKGGGQTGSIFKTRSDIPGRPVPKAKISGPAHAGA